MWRRLFCFDLCLGWWVIILSFSYRNLQFTFLLVTWYCFVGHIRYFIFVVWCSIFANRHICPSHIWNFKLDWQNYLYSCTKSIFLCPISELKTDCWKMQLLKITLLQIWANCVRFTLFKSMTGKSLFPQFQIHSKS